MDRDPIAIGVDEEIIDLLPTYIANRWKDIEIAGKALQDEDFEALRFMGHGMKGSGGGYGLHEVAQVGREIEASAREGDSARIAQLLERLRDFLERVQVFPVRET
jgi:HPt (histidine-containing phosphotransfer) domain-containing protein